LLSEELPTYLLLHWRNQKKYPNYLCPRCRVAPEDITHMLTCIQNHFWLKTLITQTVHETSRKLELRYQDLDSFAKAYIDIHITKYVPVGLITEDTLAPFNTSYEKHKYAPLIHHDITTAIYKRIWIPSRMVAHDTVLPNPAPLQTPRLNKTKPTAPSLLQKKLLKYVIKRQSSLTHLLED